MKRTNLVTNLISLLLFGAVMTYLGVYIVRSFSGDVRTAPAVYVELTDAATASGMVVRDEALISSGESYISISAENGQLVAAGETVAVAYSGEEALRRAGEIRELELKKQYILSALAESSAGTELKGRDEAIRSAVTRLSSASARHETEDIPSAAISLASLVMDDPDISVSESELNAVNDELNRLRQSSSSDTTPITAASQGLFFSLTDGFEYISPASLEGVNPQKLRELMNSPKPAEGPVIGKLADPLEWYFAAIIPSEGAQKLKIGDTATLDFGRYQREPLKASVWSVNAGTGEAVVIFRFTSAAADMLAVRSASADVVFGTISGLRVPKDAVYEEQGTEKDANGAEQPVTLRYVYTVTGLQAEKKYIKTIWEDEDYYLAEPLDPNSSAALREGNDIILTGKEIYDGMILE